MSKHLSVTVNDWVANEIIGKTKNTSSRVEELIIKGYMAERSRETLKKNDETHQLRR